MPKSKNNKTHKSRLASYNANKKKQQELLKKKMMEDYIKLQREIMTEQAHTSTEDVIDSEINIDDLNNFDDISLIDIDNLVEIPEIDDTKEVETVYVDSVDTNK